MAEEQLRLITVVGATGQQGGGVARVLLGASSCKKDEKDVTCKKKKWRVRALTRNSGSPAARSLAEQGAEIVKADISNKEDINKAFHGAYGVFAVTNFWDKECFPKDIGLEERQGKMLVDAALANKVSHFIWSSLPDVEKISGGKLCVPHFTGKNKIEQYAKTLKGLTSTFVHAGLYHANWFDLVKLKKTEDGTLDFALPVRPETQLPMIDPEDTGVFVEKILEDKEKYAGKDVLMAAEYLTLPQMVDIYKKVTGKPARYRYVEPEQLKRERIWPEELVDMFVYCDQHGYYNKADISPAREIHPHMKSFEQWLREHPQVYQ